MDCGPNSVIIPAFMSRVEVLSGPPVPQARCPPCRSRQRCRRALGQAIQGEVRFDAVSRALYSTDASVYQIEPLGVVVPRVARGHRAQSSRSATSSAARSRCAAAARRRPARPSAQALQVDTSKYFNRLLEVNVDERWARVEPGIVLDELNAQLAAARPPVRAGHLHRQPRHHRRHDGQQLQRRALGALRQDDRPRARAGRRAVRRFAWRASRPLTPAELDDDLPRRDARGGVLPRSAAAGAATTPTRSTGAFPRSCGASAATTSTRSSTRPRPFNLAQLIVGSEGTLGVVLEAKLAPGAAAERQSGDGDPVRRPARGARGDAGDPRAQSVGRRGDGPLHPRPHEAERRRSSALRRTFIEGDPGALLCVEFYGDRAEDLPPRLDALERDLAGARLRLPLPSRARSGRRRRGSGACAKRRSACRWR